MAARSFLAAPLSAMLWQARPSQANYALGESAPMCWKLDAANTPITCPRGLQIDWDESAPLPSRLAVSMPVTVKVSVNMSMGSLEELHDQGLLSKDSNLTAADKWKSCAVPQAACPDKTDIDSCCYFHVNVHSCLDKPGSFCGPWVGNDGHLATHTPAFHSSAGAEGRGVFDFDVKLFWEGRYTVIAHFKFARIHFAIGRSTTVTYSDALCDVPLVPNRDGTCELCPNGTQPLSSGIPKGGERLTDTEALALGVNPLCVPCPAGWYSPDGHECVQAAPGFFTNSSWQVDQAPCPAGTSNPLHGMTGCIGCSTGQFAEIGEPSCHLCPVGSYQGETGRPACTPCPEIRTTLSMGSSSSGHCVCPEGTYASAGNGPCSPCPRGMACPTGSAFDEFASWSQNVSSVLKIPLLEPGHYSEPSAPLVVYRCHAEYGSDICPGGAPGSCSGNRTGLVCAVCAEGHAASAGGECFKCGSDGAATIAACTFVLLLAIAGAYYVCNSPYTEASTNMIAASCAASLMIMCLQVMSFMPMLGVVWPRLIGKVMGSFSILRLSPESVMSTACFAQSAPDRFLLSCLPPLAIVVAAFLCFFVSKVLGQFRVVGRSWQLDKTFNTLMMLLQTVFVGIVLLVTSPFQCYSHPVATGESSMAMFSEVLCWEGEHMSILGLAMAVLVLFVIPFVVMCLWVMRRASAEILKRNQKFLVRFRFMIFRYRPERSSWGFVFVLRMLAYALTPLIPADYPHFQLSYMSTVSFVYLALLCFFWPWKSHELSLVDACAGLMLGVLCCLAAAFVEKAESQASYETVLVVVLSAFFLLFLGICLYITFWVCKHGLTGSFGRSVSQSTSEASQLRETLEVLAGKTKDLDESQMDVLLRLSGLGVAEHQRLANMLEDPLPAGASPSTAGTSTTQPRDVAYVHHI